MMVKKKTNISFFHNLFIVFQIIIIKVNPLMTANKPRIAHTNVFSAFIIVNKMKRVLFFVGDKKELTKRILQILPKYNNLIYYTDENTIKSIGYSGFYCNTKN